MRKNQRKYKIHLYDEPSYMKEHGGYKYPYVSIGNTAWGVFHTYKSKSQAHKRLESLNRWVNSKGMKGNSGRKENAKFRVVKTSEGYSVVQLSPFPEYQSKLDPRTKRYLK